MKLMDDIVCDLDRFAGRRMTLTTISTSSLYLPMVE